jgi:sugar-specific transcriptional regulator TrmB
LASKYGPEERALLENTAGRLYSNAVAHGHLPVTDPQVTADKARPALDLLVDIGLLVLDATGSHYLPVDPATVQNRVVVPLSRRGTDLLNESTQWAEAFSELGQAYRKAARSELAPITEIRGLRQIDDFLEANISDARFELLTAQPHGRRPAKDLALSESRDIRALERGVRMRTLYQHSARQSPATREYVGELTARGGEVRTLDEFFERSIIIDREIAVIPGSEDHHVALAVRHKFVVAYLVDIFDRAWERGRPFTAHDARSEKTIASDVRAMTIRLLVEGHSDPASAKRLGVSTRTYAGYIAALKEEYGVQTRFQLGYAMGRARANGPEDYEDAENIEPRQGLEAAARNSGVGPTS